MSLLMTLCRSRGEREDHVGRVLGVALSSLLLACSGEIEQPRTDGSGASLAIAGSSGRGGAGMGGVAGALARGGSGPSAGAGSGGTAGSAGSAAVCAAGQTSCAGGCADVQTSIAHCGTCGNACGIGQSCVGGMCQCQNGGTACGAACADTQTDEAHCGNCATACGTGQTCTLGKCECPTGLTACTTACVDVTTSNDHCGGCGQSCQGGSSCVAGVCTCPQGQKLCGAMCVDTATSGAHCGDCGVACAMGQACLAGECSGAGGVGEDGCLGGLARNVTLSRIDAFQTVKVGLMEGGQAIAAASRGSELVQGRETVFRIFVTPGSGWTARGLSARVTVVNGTTSEEHFAKKSVTGASTESDVRTTFQVTVPGEEIQADSSYHVELVECGTVPAGDAVAPRFPASSDSPLGARETGTLKVTLIPINSNSRTPDTSTAALAPYRDILDSMYPVSGVELTVGDQINAGYPVDWNGTLDQVRSKRQSDQPASDVYYYGLIAPADSFEQFCGRGCTAGIGFVTSANDSSRRVSMGIGFGGNAAGASATTLAHEIGHNHGREHAPCVPAGSSISGVDRNFPHDGGGIGVWGYDKRQGELIDPDGVTDIMGYCNNTWISDYTYNALISRVGAVSGAKVFVNPETLGHFRVLLVDAAGPRWGRPIDELTAPSGDPEAADVLDENGDVIANVVVHRTLVSDIDAASVMVPEPEPGWVSVRVSGSRAHRFDAPVVVPAP